MKNYGSQENTFTEPDSRFPSMMIPPKRRICARPCTSRQSRWLVFRRPFVAARVAAHAGMCASRAERSWRVELRKDSHADGLT